MTKYKTTIKKVGQFAQDISKAGTLILFDENDEDNFNVFGFSCPIEQITEPIKSGDKLVLNNKEFIIDSVGKTAQNNLTKNGHTVFQLEDELEEFLDNQIIIKGGPFPELFEGDEIVISD